MARTSVHTVHSQNHMNTTFEFRVSTDPTQQGLAETVLDECHQLVGRLENELTEFRPVSPVHQLNASPVGKPVAMTEAGWQLWNESRQLKERTDGAFDPLFRSQGQGIEAHDEGVLVRTTEEGHLGFGAIGKGFALDRVRTHLESVGLSDFALSAGGSSQILSGFSANHAPWSWGWSWKKHGEDSVGIQFEHGSGRPIALGVSGFHEQGRHIAGETPYVTALVGHASATQADALSTAFLIQGWESGWMEEGIALATVDEEDVPRWNGVFRDLWGGVGCAFLLAQNAWAEEVDLGELGFDDFTPYLVEREFWWVLLPVLSLVAVFVHLVKPGRAPLSKDTWEKPQ